MDFACYNPLAIYCHCFCTPLETTKEVNDENYNIFPNSINFAYYGN